MINYGIAGVIYTAITMVESLQEIAKEEGVDLSSLTIENFNNKLDDWFDDGGEVRCLRFTDYGMTYAMDCGHEIESDRGCEIQWECIEKAFELLKKQRRFKNELL